MSIHYPPGVIHMSVATMPDLPENMAKAIEESGCCWGSAVRGPEFCTCWEPVFDLEQQEPKVDLAPETRSSLCDDCAYRPDSPERTGADYVAENLMELPCGDNPFWCHKGIRRPIKVVHPTLGLEVAGKPEDYRPPEIAGVPYKADGTPADRCGGWAVRKAAQS